MKYRAVSGFPHRRRREPPAEIAAVRGARPLVAISIKKLGTCEAFPREFVQQLQRPAGAARYSGLFRRGRGGGFMLQAM
jgi:hypothetical protein